MEILKFTKKEDGTFLVYAGDKENLPKHLEIPSSHDGIPVAKAEDWCNGRQIAVVCKDGIII